ncbi:MAG TPA: TIGR03936 family radical SAM-associated protein [Mycobacteriales bacterium]|jgi:radical SAM-linked protein
MARTPDGPPPAPVAARVRIRYAKRGRLRFTSHRDVARALERALRRAGTPVAHSAGFNPHPKISYVGASPTGAASEAEYLEIGLVRSVDSRALGEALDAALPAGIDVLECVAAGPGSLAERIDGTCWRLDLPGVPVELLRRAVDAFLATEHVAVPRVTKSGRREVDARTAVVSAVVAEPDPSASSGGSSGDCAILRMVVRLVTPAVRPNDVLAALRIVADFSPPVPALVTRLAQGRLDDGGRLADPLAPDRATTAPGGPPAVGVSEDPAPSLHAPSAG